MHHYRSTRKNYIKHNANDNIADGCTFCNEVGGSRIVEEATTMYVIPNRISYDMFEGLPVIDHRMVIPMRHIESIADFTKQEQSDFMKIVGTYEKEGYSIYARGSDNVNRSVRHQHTHLIRLGKKKPTLVLHIRKPHILLTV